jgi:hypothetical protein
MSFGYSRHAAPPASGVSVSSIEIGLYPTFFLEKSPFICIYPKKVVPLHPQRFLTEIKTL